MISTKDIRSLYKTAPRSMTLITAVLLIVLASVVVEIAQEGWKGVWTIAAIWTGIFTVNWLWRWANKKDHIDE